MEALLALSAALLCVSVLNVHLCRSSKEFAVHFLSPEFSQFQASVFVVFTEPFVEGEIHSLVTQSRSPPFVVRVQALPVMDFKYLLKEN